MKNLLIICFLGLISFLALAQNNSTFNNTENTETIDMGQVLDTLKDWESDSDPRGIASSDQEIDMESDSSNNSHSVLFSFNSTTPITSNENSTQQALNNLSNCDILNCQLCSSQHKTCDTCIDGYTKTNEGTCQRNNLTVSSKCNLELLKLSMY